MVIFQFVFWDCLPGRVTPRTAKLVHPGVIQAAAKKKGKAAVAEQGPSRDTGEDQEARHGMESGRGTAGFTLGRRLGVDVRDGTARLQDLFC